MIQTEVVSSAAARGERKGLSGTNLRKISM